MPARQAERRSQWPSSAPASQGGGGGGGGTAGGGAAGLGASGRGPSRPAVKTPETVSTVQRKPLAVSATLGRLMSTTAARHRRAQLPDTPHPPPQERDTTPAPSRPHPPPPPAAVAVSARAPHTRLPLSHSAPNTRMPAPSRPPPPPPPPPAVAVSARAPNTRPPVSARPPPAPTPTPANPPATSVPAHAGTNTPFGSASGARQTHGQYGSLGSVGRTPPPPPRRAPPDLPRVGGSSAVQVAGSVTGGAAASSSWAQPSKEALASGSRNRGHAPPAGAAQGGSRGVRVSSSSSYTSALPAPSTRLTLANAEANAQTSRASAAAIPAAAPRLTRTRPDIQTKFEAQRYAPNSKDTQAQAHAQNISQYGPSLTRNSGA
jgi:hypothetical protein